MRAEPPASLTPQEKLDYLWVESTQRKPQPDKFARGLSVVSLLFGIAGFVTGVYFSNRSTALQERTVIPTYPSEGEAEITRRRGRRRTSRPRV